MSFPFVPWRHRSEGARRRDRRLRPGNIRSRSEDPALSEIDFNPLSLPDRVIRAANWARTVPELRTRPHLLAAMADDVRLRRGFMRQVEELVCLTDGIYGLPSANLVVNLVYKHGVEVLHIIEQRITDHRAANEMFGAYRNVWRNVMLRLHDGKAYNRFGPHDIRRKLHTEKWEDGAPVSAVSPR